MMDYTIFGESHGPAVGVLLRDVPPGLPVDEEFAAERIEARLAAVLLLLRLLAL